MAVNSATQAYEFAVGAANGAKQEINKSIAELKQMLEDTNKRIDRLEKAHLNHTHISRTQKTKGVSK